MKILEQKIVELTFTPIPQLAKKLKRLGMDSKIYEDGQSILIEGQIRVGLHESDPTTKAVMLGFAILGARWASIVPGLLESVKKERVLWREK